jgi:hypothetical protein
MRVVDPNPAAILNSSLSATRMREISRSSTMSLGCKMNPRRRPFFSSFLIPVMEFLLRRTSERRVALSDLTLNLRAWASAQRAGTI